MANPATRKDPLPAFCFKVKVIGGGDAFFRSVSGLRYETEVVPVKEGGVNNTTFQLPGSTKWANIVLKQGFTASSELIKWRQKWLNGEYHRMTGTIIQLDTALNPAAQGKFHKGWPCKWSMADLDASKSELAIETLEICHEGLSFAGGGK